MNRIVRMALLNIFKLPGMYRKLCKYAKNTEQYPELEKWQHISKMMQAAIAKSNVDLQVFGKENIPQENGYMIYSNHQGLFDVVAIAADFPGPLACVFKKELEDKPLLKQILICTKSFAMDREDVRQSLTVIQNVTEEVKNGRAYVIFPEGTRSKTGNRMRDFHAGSFRAATKSKATVLPVAFIDCFKVLDQKGSKPLQAQLHYLKPIPYEAYEGMKPAELAALVKERIQAGIDENT